MKSDQVQRSTKGRSKTAGPVTNPLVPVHAPGWPLAYLLVAKKEDIISDEKELLIDCVSHLDVSPIVRAMMKEASEQGWRVGVMALDAHDFHLDVPEKLLLLNNSGMDAATLSKAAYFRNALLVSFIRALRDIWQEKRHGGFDENYAAESVLLLERIRAADCDVMTILAGWELRGANRADIWRHIMGSDDGDMALAFSNYLERDPAAFVSGKAAMAAFRQWFCGAHRVNACDHETLEYMDGIIATSEGSNAFGKKRAGKICIEVLSCLPDKTAYLRSRGEDILSDPLYAGLADPINQSHYMHIVRDANLVYMQGVAFRDSELAARIFPNGEMTPEKESVPQKS